MSIRSPRADHRTYRGIDEGTWCGHDTDHFVRTGYLTQEAAVRWITKATVPNKRSYVVREHEGAYAVACIITPEGADLGSETIQRQDRAGMKPGNEPRLYGGEWLLPCPDHPEFSAVDCTICEPVDYAPATEPQHQHRFVIGETSSATDRTRHKRGRCECGESATFAVPAP